MRYLRRVRLVLRVQPVPLVLQVLRVLLVLQVLLVLRVLLALLVLRVLLVQPAQPALRVPRVLPVLPVQWALAFLILRLSPMARLLSQHQESLSTAMRLLAEEQANRAHSLIEARGHPERHTLRAPSSREMVRSIRRIKIIRHSVR